AHQLRAVACNWQDSRAAKPPLNVARPSHPNSASPPSREQPADENLNAANSTLMHRRNFLRLAALGGAATIATPALAKSKANAAPPQPPRRVKSFDLEEMTITQL